MHLRPFSLCLLTILLAGCSGSTSAPDTYTSLSSSQPRSSQSSSGRSSSSQSRDGEFYTGADLSYVNELLDCGVQYRQDNIITDPYQLFANAGTDIVRVRLWHNPDWTQYSNFADVRKTIERAHAAGLKVLLDFHYSDTWADPHKQIIPAAWEHLYGDTEALAQALNDYTQEVLAQLAEDDQLPEYVQIGNETNIEILKPASTQDENASINWPRSIALFHSGLAAVDDINTRFDADIQTMIHIAQPENAVRWFAQATAAGLDNFDLIGLSYYPKWSEVPLSELDVSLIDLHDTYQKPVMIVETAYPWTLENFDQANNILGSDSLISGYPATKSGQRQYLLDLKHIVQKAGGLGVIYWEPAWVSSACSTLWGTGSHWENASLFDAANNNNPLPAMDFFAKDQ